MTAKQFYDICYNYLLEIKPQQVENLDKYFVGDDKDYNNLNDIYYRLTVSGRNYQSMPNVIGYKEKKNQIDEILFNYDYIQILENYTAESLYYLFREVFNITSTDSKMNTWYKWSNSIIDSARFISKFQNIEDFKRFISCYAFNTYTRASLPMLLEKEIKGIGFALACDFLKELGYTEYCKPDVHIIEIISEFDGLDKNYDQYEAFKRFTEVALLADTTPYKLDKIVWLICSGNFYMDEIKIKPHKIDLINKLKITGH